MSTVILASQSPRRKELLQQLGYQFSSVSPDIDESVQENESPTLYVERLAKEKALSIACNQSDSTIVLGSDTCVVFQDMILGKPKNKEQCYEYLSMLSGNVHQVLTSVAVVQGKLSKTVVVSTSVEFTNITANEIECYWRTGEPKDKAGAYGIQGIGGQFVKSITGSYSAVVGLPLCETKQLLAEFGEFNQLNSLTE